VDPQIELKPLFRKLVKVMKAYVLSFAVGVAVGLLYAALRVKSPAPPLVALVGLLGMVWGEEGYQWIVKLIR
jgi:XapX domain-containing protein